MSVALDSGMRHIALARQPIIDRHGALVAYELLFRYAATDTEAHTEHGAPGTATASVIHTAFAEIGMAEVLGQFLGYINVDTVFLSSGYVSLLPAGKVVLELLETIDSGPEVVARCEVLKKQGYRIALDDYDGRRTDLKALLALADVVKVDLTLVKDSDLRALVRRLRRPGRSLLAEKVETRAQYRRCLALGFDLFQGFHFARPETMSAHRPSANRLALLQLLTLVMNDANAFDIESAFKPHADLSVTLLRLANSAAFGLHSPIGSVRQAVVMLGRRRLEAWLQLLLYTAGHGRGGIPLLQLASTRGRFLELVAGVLRPEDPEFQDLGFMAGILSLMDSLLEVSMASLVAQINPVPAVKAALLGRHGELGQLLRLAEQLDTADGVAVAETLSTLPPRIQEGLMRCQLDAYQWANAVTATVEGPSKRPDSAR